MRKEKRNKCHSVSQSILLQIRLTIFSVCICLCSTFCQMIDETGLCRRQIDLMRNKRRKNKDKRHRMTHTHRQNPLR
jgi:hypothetical protein